MKLDIRLIAGARRNVIVRELDDLGVYLTAPAIGGRANKALIDILADYFKVAKSQVKIIKGEKVRNKIVEIL